MAIEIIKQGQTKFTAQCCKCGCEFSYEMVDVIGEVVVCPCCGNHIMHIGTMKYPYRNVSPCTTGYLELNTQTITPPKNCEECEFYKNYFVVGKSYIGDSPCQWCVNSPYQTTCKEDK